MQNIHKVLWFFLLLSQVMTAFSQQTVDSLSGDTAKVFIKYMMYSGYENENAYISYEEGALFLGEKAAIYIYQYQSPDEFLRITREKANVIRSKKGMNDIREDKEIIENYIKDLQIKNDIEKWVSVVFLRVYSSSDYLMLKVRPDGDVWISYNAVFNWTPVNEFKTIAGYKCQKATRIDSDGNQNIAWFTEEIPFSVGPLNLEGLPGLILEYHNPGTKRFFRAVAISSTDIPEQNFRKWLTGPIVSKDEYREMYEGDSKKLQQMMRMAEIKNN